MTQPYKLSFHIIIGLMFLLPVFFIPSFFGLESAKFILLAAGVIVAALAYLAEVWKRKEVSMPRHWIMLAAVLLPTVYLVSALASTPSSLSLFGYSFEIGTFGYIALASAALLLSSAVLTDASRILRALAAFFFSFLFIAVFSTIKVLFGGSPTLGMFQGAMGTMLGRWTDLGIALGLLSVFLALSIGMIPMKKNIKITAYAVFFLVLALLAVVNFPTVFGFTLAASIILVVYFSTVESHFLNVLPQQSEQKRFFSKPTFLPILLGVFSLVFLLNPAWPGGVTISERISRVSGVSNAEVRPSFSATLSVSKAALSEGPLLGSGPNSWSRDWLTYKPAGVNSTPFWGVVFPYGAGFVPTQVSSTGALGTIVWLAFFISLVLLGKRALASVPESRTLRFALMASLLCVFYLWATSFFYAPSFAMLSITFIMTGVLLAASAVSGAVPIRTTVFSRDAATNFTATLAVALLALGTIAMGVSAFNKTISVFYFKKAADLSSANGSDFERIEGALEKAIKFAPADIHYSAIAQVRFAKAQAAVSRTDGDPAENLAVFEREISASIDAARSAISANPAGYSNWLTLGSIYAFLTPQPLAVSGAYENSIASYSEAAKRNPSSPEIPLLAAQLELSRGNLEAARTLARQALALKEDYADAYVFIAQMELTQNNVAVAVASAERAALLMPTNPNIHFELGLLKYASEDWAGAIGALSQAINIAPGYADALYYRGLSLARLSSFEQAVADFEALAQSNPDNEEVKRVLEDLKAGRNIFSQ